LFHVEDSVLNRLTDTERATAINDLAQMARQTAESSSLRHDADAQVRQRLEELLAHNGQKIEIQWSSGQDKNGTLEP
jgi:hypothetical protein